MLQLYKNIKQRRLELHMTQTDLAKKMGYADKSMIAKIEKGLVDLPQSKILAFAEVLQTTPSDLMGTEGTVIASATIEVQTIENLVSNMSDDDQQMIIEYSELDESSKAFVRSVVKREHERTK